MELYFAYGSNLSEAQMRRRCPGCRLVGLARLEDHRLVFDRVSERWGGGVADVIPVEGERVWGALWELTAADLSALDGWEGVDRGGYRRVRREIVAEQGVKRAWVYEVARKDDPVTPSSRYLNQMIEAAHDLRLPAEWIARLSALRDRSRDR